MLVILEKRDVCFLSCTLVWFILSPPGGKAACQGCVILCLQVFVDTAPVELVIKQIIREFSCKYKKKTWLFLPIKETKKNRFSFTFIFQRQDLFYNFP